MIHKDWIPHPVEGNGQPPAGFDYWEAGWSLDADGNVVKPNQKEPMLIQPDNLVTLFECKKCDFKAEKEQDMIAHVVKDHVEVEKAGATCDVCGFTAKNAHGLKIHRKKHR